MFSGYGPHILYSAALVSVSTNLLYQKKHHAEQRSRLSARISILESIAEQLKSDKPLSAAEIERLRKLADPAEAVEEEPIMSWREALLGRKTGES